MILTCPACSTRFLVPDAAFARPAANGGITYRSRRVRCGKCKHEWQAEAPATTQPLDFASMITDAVPDLSAASVPTQPIPAGSNLPVKIKRKWLGKLEPRRNIALLILAFILALVALAAIAPAGLAWLQGTAGTVGTAINSTFGMESAPRLTIENVTTRYAQQTAAAPVTGATVPDALGTQVPTGSALIVEGTIVNQTDDEQTVPALLLFTKDAQGALLGSYRPTVQMQTLPAHGQTGFTIQLGAADPKMTEVTVQFAAE